jgi:hypothetical protein
MNKLLALLSPARQVKLRCCHDQTRRSFSGYVYTEYEKDVPHEETWTDYKAWFIGLGTLTALGMVYDFQVLKKARRRSRTALK